MIHYAFIEWGDHVEDYYCKSFDQAKSILERRLRQIASDKYGTIVTKLGIEFPEHTWIVTKNSQVMSLASIIQEFGTLEDFLLCSLDEQAILEPVNWCKEGF